MPYIDNGEHLFSLNLKPFKNDQAIHIHAYDGGNEPGYMGAAAARIVVEVRQGGVSIFPRGQLYCSTPRMGTQAVDWSVDGDRAKELVCALVAMKPGDTDDDYFDGYSEAQLAWAEKYGEAIGMIALDRYGEP